MRNRPENDPVSVSRSIDEGLCINSRVASFLSFFRDPRPPHVVGNPQLRESVKLLELCLRVVFRGVAHVNPVDQKLLDLVTGVVRILFMVSVGR